MKKMKNSIKLMLAAVICALGFISTLQAQEYQKGFRLGFGLNTGYLTGDEYSVGLGADARLQYDVSKKTSLAFTTGYTHFFKDNLPDDGFIPLKMGFKSFLGNKFYVLGEAGAALGVINDTGNTFLWTPGIGYATRHIDLSVRYENYNEYLTTQVALRLAYGFSLKKKNR